MRTVITSYLIIALLCAPALAQRPEGGSDRGDRGSRGGGGFPGGGVVFQVVEVAFQVVEVFQEVAFQAAVAAVHPVEVVFPEVASLVAVATAVRAAAAWRWLQPGRYD